MKTHKKNTLHFIFNRSFLSLIATAMVVSACQTETSDLYQVKQPSLEAQLSDIEIKDPSLDSNQLAANPDLSLPTTGDVQRPNVNRATGINPVAQAQMIDVSQVISVQRNPVKPMLDLLFVIDDSNSMEPHQNNLAAAMKSFTDELSKLNLLDYRIGVTSIYDSKRYFKQQQVGSDRYEQGISEWSRTEAGRRNFYRLGRLLPFKNTRTGQLDLNTRFATPETDLRDLEATLKIGAQVFEKYDLYDYFDSNNQRVSRGQNRFDGAYSSQEPLGLREVLVTESRGPRFEELLAPMMAALAPQSLLFGANATHYRNQFPSTHSLDSDRWQAPSITDSQRNDKWMDFALNYNNSFIREKAHLGIIFVTDVTDQSVGISARAAVDSLIQLKGDDGSFSKISTFGVLHKNTVSYGLQRQNAKEWKRRHCTANNRVDDDVRNVDGFTTPQLLEQFLRMTGGNRAEGSNILNICSNNYGQNLVQIAKDLFKKSVQRGEYDLDRVPAQNLKVVFRNNPTKVVPTCQNGQSEELCWQLQISPGVRKLILLSQDDLGTQELLVTYQAIDPRSANTLNSRQP